MKSRVPLTIQAAKRATLGSMGICAVTTVHHVYGAYIYNTPWRLHAAVISALATALIAVSLRLLRRRSNDGIGVVASWTFMTITFLVPFLGFGVFEGVYNHALKIALYFAHTSPVLMARLFPPPTYEMPNDAFFEITGVMQVIPGFVTGYYLYRFVQGPKKPTEATCDSQVYAE
jgi:hypothetical protein